MDGWQWITLSYLAFPGLQVGHCIDKLQHCQFLHSLSLDKWNGNKNANNIGDTDDFQKDSCILMFKDSNKNYQSNQYTFKKESGANCITGNGGTYLGQSFICQKSLGNIDVNLHKNLTTPYIL